MHRFGTRIRLAARVFIVCTAVVHAAPSVAADNRGVTQQGLPRSLRDTGLYADWETKTVRAENLPFAPQYQLWADGARKRRWIFIPKGARVDATNADDWKFPVGTTFWKEFRFAHRVETRIIKRARNGWVVGAYAWNEDQTEAVIVPPEGLPGYYEFEPGRRHGIPGVADCAACHEAHPSFILGFSAIQLSPVRDPLAPEPVAPSEELLDLPKLFARGLIRGDRSVLLEPPPQIEAPSSTARAAIGYLHGNCGNCHNARGPLASLGLDLWYSLTDEGDASVIRSALRQRSRWRPPGVDVDGDRIAPGLPEKSALLLRMSSRHPLMQMPPLATGKPHAEAIRLVEQWIRELGTSSQPRRQE